MKPKQIVCILVRSAIRLQCNLVAMFVRRRKNLYARPKRESVKSEKVREEIKIKLV